MTLIGIKNKNEPNLHYFEEKIFSNDKKEEYLHKLIEKEPRLIFEDIMQGTPALLGSRVNLPSGKQIDLLFCSSTGEIIIVELKRDKSPNDVLAQLINYESSIKNLTIEQFFSLKIKKQKQIFDEIGGEIDEEEFSENLKKSFKNPQLLLVSYEISDEVKRMATSYRQHNYLINCVEFDYFIDEKDNEIFIPEVIGFEETTEIKKKDLSSIQKNYLDFFNILIEKFKEKKPITTRKALPDSWISLPIGYSEYHLEWNIAGRGQNKNLYVGLHLENKLKEKNIQILKELKREEEKISRLLVEKIKFMEWGKNWAKIEVAYLGKFNLETAKEDKELLNWAIKTMIKFFEFFKESGLFDDIVRKYK